MHLYLTSYIDGDSYTYTCKVFIGMFSSKEKAEDAILEHHEKCRPNEEFFEHDYDIEHVEADKVYLD